MAYDKDALADFAEQVADEGNPRIFTSVDEGLAAVQSLPQLWEPLRLADRDRRQALDALWSEVGSKLPKTLKTLHRKLVGFAILATDTRPISVLYLFDEGRDLMARRGFWPAATLPDVAQQFSVDLAPFYRLHDGWVNLFGGESGPLPSGQWRVIGREPGVNGFLEVFSRGAQGLGFDLDESPARAFSIDTDEEEVEEVQDFWQELDDRLAAGMRSFPDVT